jgi:two-component system, chemotaxis family, protein-glutamate methylesterase/glutaminase
MSIRVLIADHSAAFGRVIKEVLEAIADVEVCGLCRNAQAANQRILSESPDLVVLDVELPPSDCLDVLRAMRQGGMRAAAILIGEATGRSRELTARALELGALDFVQRTDSADEQESLSDLRERLVPLVAAAVRRKEVQTILRGSPSSKPAGAAIPAVPGSARPTVRERSANDCPMEPRSRLKPAMVLIGVSTGGPEALARLVPALPANLRVPVLIVQHMPPHFTQNLAEKLNESSALRVKEAEAGETARQGSVYIAPGGKHLKVIAGPQNQIVLRTSDDPPENNCRPAVDVLFRSAAEAFPGLAVAVILTGMGRDGTLGLRDLRSAGAVSIAQDEASCTIFGMPKEAIQAGLVDVVAPLHSIASEIVKAVC